MIESREDVPEKMRLYGLPTHMYGGMERYLYDRLKTGDFLRAVLENDLVDACARADIQNRAVLFGWGRFMYEELPIPCYGNSFKVDEWLRGYKLYGF